MLFRVLMFVVCLAAAAAGSPLTSLYFFGDSLTDTGNVFKATSTLGRYTFGLIPTQPAAPYVGGRFTNGPVWAEHAAERLDRAEDAAPAGMSLGVFGKIGGRGNNYAVGGARTDSGGALGWLNFLIPTGLARQVGFYLTRTQGIADPGGLYFVMAGGNDLRDAARIADPGQRKTAAQQAGENIAYAVRDLYLAGARQFVLVNSSDVGLIPETIGDGLSEAGTDAALQFNTWLDLYAHYLRNVVPDFSLEYFDLFGLHRELVSEYGIDAVRPCKSETAGTCDETLFFDSVHPTAWVHEIIGNRLADQILGRNLERSFHSTGPVVANPEPSTILLAMSAAALLMLERRRRSGIGALRVRREPGPGRTFS